MKSKYHSYDMSKQQQKDYDFKRYINMSYTFFFQKAFQYKKSATPTAGVARLRPLCSYAIYITLNLLE